VDNVKASELLDKAIEVDPNFFMPHFNIAMNNLPNNEENFKKFANKAVSINAKLSDAEDIFKQILERWLKDKKSDVTDLGAKLIELYPKDAYAYIYQSFFNIGQGKPEEAITNLKEAIALVDYKAPYYNLLGYNYLATNKMKEAEKAFDKYIELEPNEANPYDSKGDYFMAVKNYKAAHENFMKAYKIDTNFKASLKKANKAKMMLDSLGKE